MEYSKESPLVIALKDGEVPKIINDKYGNLGLFFSPQLVDQQGGLNTNISILHYHMGKVELNEHLKQFIKKYTELRQSDYFMLHLEKYGKVFLLEPRLKDLYVNRYPFFYHYQD